MVRPAQASKPGMSVRFGAVGSQKTLPQVPWRNLALWQNAALDLWPGLQRRYLRLPVGDQERGHASEVALDRDVVRRLPDQDPERAAHRRAIHRPSRPPHTDHWRHRDAVEFVQEPYTRAFRPYFAWRTNPGC